MLQHRQRFITDRLRATVAFVALLLPIYGQEPAQEAENQEPRSIQRIQPVEPPDGIGNDHILGIIPNFQTISDPSIKVQPLTVRQKFTLFVKETVDPFTFVSAAMGAGLSQAGDNTPKYGEGVVPYSERFAAAFAD